MRSGEEHTAKIDVSSFALILFKLVVSLPALGRTITSEELEKLRVNALKFQELFRSLFLCSLSQDCPQIHERHSFNDISESLKENCSRRADGVDSNEVSAFASLVEYTET
jgi:hypothetical protein